MIYIILKDGKRVFLRSFYTKEEEKYKELTSKFCDKNIRAIVAETDSEDRVIPCNDIVDIVRK